MHLTSVRLRGFRTFARSTEVNFGPGLTMVVGPHGCGKTNLLQGIRWCLDDDEKEHPVDPLFFRGTPEVRPSSIAEVTIRLSSASGRPVTLTRTRFRRDRESTLATEDLEPASPTELPSVIMPVHSPAGLSLLAATGCRNRILLIDAVDDGLDESELASFHTDLDTLGRHNQLVIVTHNKRTMDRADTIFGITMEVFGVSAVVPMRLR